MNNIADNALNLGFTSCGAKNHISPPWEYFKNSQVINSAQKMMMGEQGYAAAENPPGFGPPDTLNECGHWEPLTASGGTGSASAETYTLNNTLTSRHNGKADVLYGDVHAEAAFWWQATNVNNVVAAY